MCSVQFIDDQYCQGRKAKGARLKKDAVPQVFALMADDEDSACKAFDVLWEYLDASEDTLVTVRQLPDDQQK